MTRVTRPKTPPAAETIPCEAVVEIAGRRGLCYFERDFCHPRAGEGELYWVSVYLFNKETYEKWVVSAKGARSSCPVESAPGRLMVIRRP